MQHVLDHVLLDRLRVDPVGVLRGDEDALDLDRPLAPSLVDLVADGDLSLPVRTAGTRALPPCARPRAGAQIRCASMIGIGISSARLARRVAEHHSLVARADARRADRRRRDRAAPRTTRRRRARCRATAGRSRRRRRTCSRRNRMRGVGVADRADRLAHDVRDVDVRLVVISPATTTRPVVIERLAGDASLGIVAQHGVEHGVRDLVGDLVGCPSVTDSDVKRNSRADHCAWRLRSFAASAVLPIRPSTRSRRAARSPRAPRRRPR